jgi:hypothetical protein
MRRLLATLLGVCGAIALADCNQTFHPLEAAEECRCSPSQYCRVRGDTHATECVAMPTTCPDPPTCGCLGSPLDACREELGRFTVLEQRTVSSCDECSREEYCWLAGQSPTCGVIPARCDDTPTCDCLVEARRGLGHLVCNERHGRLEASLH